MILAKAKGTPAKTSQPATFWVTFFVAEKSNMNDLLQ
jgi:hypothetical protein